MDYPCPMNDPQIRFDDGAAYEDFMGKWSQLAGDTFLQWLAPPPGRRWVDVGCGNGAFTEMLVERCAPIEVQGIDPSEEQVAFARTRLAGYKMPRRIIEVAQVRRAANGKADYPWARTVAIEAAEGDPGRQG